MKRTVIKLAATLVMLHVCSLSALAGDIKSSGVKGNWSSPSTWVGGALPTATDNVIIADGDSVTLDKGPLVIAGLAIGEGAAARLRFSTTESVKLTVNGNVSVSASAAFVVASSSGAPGGNLVDTLVITGNLTNQGTLDFRAGTSNSSLTACNVFFTGSSNSVVTVGEFRKSPDNNEFSGITINKSGTARVILQSDVVAAGGSSSITTPGGNPYIIFVRGLVEARNGALVAIWTDALSMQGASDSSYVIGYAGRALSNSGTATRDFPIGDDRGYRPVRIRNASVGGATGHYVRVGAIGGNANTGSSTLAGGIDKVSAVRYYRVSYHVKGTTSGAPQMTLDKYTLSYGLNDGVAAGNQNLRVALADSLRSTWTGAGPSTSYTTALDSLPRLFTSDSTARTLLNGGASIHAALARVAGTSENSLEGSPSSVEQVSDIPQTFALEQNYPNPFNPSTTLEFSIPKSGHALLEVFNVRGQPVAKLVDSELTAGTYRTAFDASKLSSGVYLYRLQVGGFVLARKMVLVK